MLYEGDPPALASGVMRMPSVIMISSLAVAIAGCAGATQWAGLTKAQAIDAAKEEAIRSDYRGDASRFSRNLWDIDTRRSTFDGRKVWLVKFYDGQALKAACAYAWKRQAARTRHVRCAATALGAGQPER